MKIYELTSNIEWVVGNPTKSEETNYSLQEGLGDPNNTSGEGRAKGRAEEGGKHEDPTRHQEQGVQTKEHNIGLS